MGTNYEKRVASLRSFEPPDATRHVKDPKYARALLNATSAFAGLTREETADKLGLAASTLRSYSNSANPTEMPYSVQYGLEQLVASSNQDQETEPCPTKTESKQRSK